MFEEVLEGVQPTKSIAEVQTEETREVDDISEWTDYDAIEVEMEADSMRTQLLRLVLTARRKGKGVLRQGEGFRLQGKVAS